MEGWEKKPQIKALIEKGKVSGKLATHDIDNVILEIEGFDVDDIEKLYELIETSEERRVSDIRAISYTYRAVYDEVEFRIMQTVLIYLDNVYSITYTARAEDFEEHLGDVEAILDSFRFR